MTDVHRVAKIHIVPSDSQRATLGGFELAMPFCRRPIETGMTITADFAGEWARWNQPHKIICIACKHKSGIEFPKNPSQNTLPTS